MAASTASSCRTMTTFTGADMLVAVFAAAFLQDLSYTSKTVLVSRGRRTLAVAADIIAMLASSLYLILTASVTIRSGFSIATLEAFSAIAIGGACGTIAGMLAAEWMEQRLVLGLPRSARFSNRKHDHQPDKEILSPMRSTEARGGLSGHSAPSVAFETTKLQQLASRQPEPPGLRA